MIDSAAAGRVDDILKWAAGRLPLQAEQVRFAVGVAVRAGGADGFGAAKVLDANFGWPADMALARLLQQVCDGLFTALRNETGQWVARTGLRVPAAKGDAIEFEDASGFREHGAVGGVDRLLAQAIVCRSRDEQAVLVPAERIIANLTQKRYAPETPVLGMRYADAPALAAAAAATPPPAAPPRATVAVEPLPADLEVEHRPDCARCHDSGMYHDSTGGEVMCACGYPSPGAAA